MSAALATPALRPASLPLLAASQRVAASAHRKTHRVPAQIDLNHPDKLGNTSLHQAALFDQSVMIHMFLEKGASTTATNNIGEVRAAHCEARALW